LLAVAVVSSPGVAPASASVPKQDAVRMLRQVQSARATGAGLSPLLWRLAVSLPGLRGAQRQAAAALLARPTDQMADPVGDGYSVPEAPGSPYCAGAFCVHWVNSGPDAPDLTDANADSVPDWVTVVAAAASESAAGQHGELGWRAPVSDGSLGGGVGRVDVYLSDLGGGLYGYTATDPGQTVTVNDHSMFSYIVIDNDYGAEEFPGYASPAVPMRVTLAHEYNHVLQAGYDALADVWMCEATAVWVESYINREIRDYLQFLYAWSMQSTVPLTAFWPQDMRSQKAYAAAVWNIWLSNRFGPEIVRGAWESLMRVSPKSFALGAYDAAIRAAGGAGFSPEFALLAAATAEWRAPGGEFADGPLYPDMLRQGVLRVNGPATATELDHTSFALFDVPTGDERRIRLAASTGTDASAAVALVGLGGHARVIALRELPAAGAGAVTVTVPEGLTRLTAVAINSDMKQLGQSPPGWLYEHDNQPFELRASSDFTRPLILSREPAPASAHVARNARVTIRFSEPMRGLSRASLMLVGPKGAVVRARLTVKWHGRFARLTPVRSLRANTRYQVRLTSDVTDLALNSPRLPRTWSFTTVGH
jgi:hypothetical protein